MRYQHGNSSRRIPRVVHGGGRWVSNFRRIPCKSVLPRLRRKFPEKIAIARTHGGPRQHGYVCPRRHYLAKNVLGPGPDCYQPLFCHGLSIAMARYWWGSVDCRGIGRMGRMVFFAVSLCLGPWNVLRGRPNPTSFHLRRDVGIWAGILANVHTAIGLRVHLRGRM